MEFQEYKNIIKQGLITQPIGKIIDMEDTVNPKNRDFFIEAIAQLVDEGFGNDDGWEVEMNSLKTRYRKIVYPFNKKEITKQI